MQGRDTYSFQVAHEDHVALVDTHVLVGQCLEINAIFKQFLVKVLDTEPSALATLADYQIPHGKLKGSKVLHILHWPSNPTPPSTQSALSFGPAKFRFDSYTLKVVSDTLPTAREERVFNS